MSTRMLTSLVLSLSLMACDRAAEPGVDSGASAAALINRGGSITHCYPDTKRWGIWLGQICYVEDCCTATLVPPALYCYTRTVDGYACRHR